MSRRGKKRSCSRPDSLLGYLRLRRGLSIQELATATGISPMVLWHMEQMDFGVQLRFAKRIADFYEISLDEIVSNDFSVLARTGPIVGLATEEKYFITQELLHSKQLSIGRRGELLVAQLEFQKLMPSGLQSAVDAAAGLVPGNGYNVFSLTLDRKPLYIEVKTTIAKYNAAFHMSVSEKKFMEDCYMRNSRYELHRIIDLNGIPQRIIYKAEDLIKAEFKPCDFIVDTRSVDLEKVRNNSEKNEKGGKCA